MQTRILNDGTKSFNVSIIENHKNSPLVVFAAGAGGQPERYITLLNTIAEYGFVVIAPHFKPLASPFPDEDELILRARQISLAVDEFIQPGSTLSGVGHSIGGAILLALAGAGMWLGPDRPVKNIHQDIRLRCISLLAPPTDFFQAPGSLKGVNLPIQAWVGSKDNITPPSQIKRLAHLPIDSQADIKIVEGAKHFSFMDVPPPHIMEEMTNKQEFLNEYSSEVSRFLVRP